MLNMTKMELYRMFHTKSMYIIWVVFASLLLVTTHLCKIDYDHSQEKDATQQEEIAEVSGEDISLGMVVTLPTEPGKTVTVQDIFFANSQGNFYALFLVIFAVIFSTADSSSGYLKNIGGQIKNRGLLVLSKAVALAVFTMLTLVGALVFQALANYFIFGTLVWGSAKATVVYFLTAWLLHYALVLVCMALAIVLKNNVISMVLVLCIIMNVMTIVYSVVDYAIQKMGIRHVTVNQYTLTGKLSELPMNPSAKACLSAVWVAVAFIVVVLSVSGMVFQKRDV